jgi:hypothetical protein
VIALREDTLKHCGAGGGDAGKVADLPLRGRLDVTCGFRQPQAVLFLLCAGNYDTDSFYSADSHRRPAREAGFCFALISSVDHA